MKYLERYMIEELKLKPIGKLSQSSNYVCDSCGLSGVDVIIDGQETGLFITDADYVNWLEKKVEECESVVHVAFVGPKSEWDLKYTDSDETWSVSNPNT